MTADGTRTLAHFRSTNGSWKLTPRLRHLQLTNEASRTRTLHDVNLDLTVVDGVTVSADFKAVDMKSDFLLGGFGDGDGNEYVSTRTGTTASATPTPSSRRRPFAHPRSSHQVVWWAATGCPPTFG